MVRFYQYNVGVAAEFDLTLSPFYRVKGQEWPQLPGLMAATPPKRAARGREDDRLLVYLTLSGNAPFSSAEYNQLTGELVGRFYQTPGSLTAAMRATAEALNRFLVNRNMRFTGKGQYMVGRLILGALRGGQFTIAQCGPTHVFHLTGGETRQVHDSQASGRGLGVGQATPVYFSQADLRAGDLLVFCADLSSGWEAALLGERSPAPEALRRKLLTIDNDDLNAVMVQVQAGQGKVNILKGTSPASARPAPAAPAAQADPAPAPAAAADQAAETPPARPVSQIASEQPASRFTRLLAGKQSVPAAAAPAPEGESAAPVTAPPLQPATEPAAAATRQVKGPAQKPAAPRQGLNRGMGRFVSPRRTGDLPEIKRPIPPGRRKAARGLAKVIQGMRDGLQKIAGSLRNFLPNLLPGLREGESQEAGSSLAILAVVIPVVVVAIASTVYIQYGRSTQYQQDYEKALEQAAQARGLTNPTDVRHAWDTTIYYLDLADKSQKTQPSQDLRQEAQTALDNLDGILRLGFSRAIVGSLSRSVQISQMAATDTDLYILDASRGGVIRAFNTSQGYEVDPSFKCDPGQYDTTVVGALVDIQALPMSNVYNARLLAMDGSGTLLYCGLSDPVAVSLVPPQLGWKSITAFTLDSDGKNLYILDPAGSAVWQYTGSYGQFTDLPIMFFGEQVPQNMETVIDLAANNADMYLLFQDGHVTSCPLSRYDVAPMRCTDPATFVDTRPERQPGPKINDAIFTQMTFASAPDPSLYMLEPLTRAVYRFSPRSDSLELRGQFRATMEVNNTLFDGPATALAISPNRYIFFSIGSQVFYATDVP